MSARPSAPGSSPRSPRERRLSDRRATAVIFSRTLRAPPPRWPGRSCAAQALAASRSQGWVIAVNDSRPGWPKTARSHVSAELLAGRVGDRQPGAPGDRAQQGPGRLARGLVRVGRQGRGGLLAAQAVAGRPQGPVGDLGALLADAVLDPGQDLHDDERRQAAQADLPGLGDRRAGQVPLCLVGGRVGGDGGAPADVVGGAVAVLALAAAAARRDPARPERGQRPDPGVGQEVLDPRAGDTADPPRVRLAQPGPLPLAPARRHPLAAGNQAPVCPARQRRQFPRASDLLRGPPVPCQPGRALPAQAVVPAAVRRRGAPGCPADLTAHQRVRGRQRQHPGLRVPAGFREEARVQGSGQPRRLAGQDDAAEHAGRAPRRRPGPGPARARRCPSRRSRHHRPRAGHPVHGLPQPGRVRVQVHLRRGRVHMTENVLCLVECAARVQEVGPAGMAEHGAA